MSHDVYHEMFMHITWHTKGSTPFIVPQMEQDLYPIIRRRAVEPGGVFVHEIGGTADHIHLVVRVNPTLALPEWIGKIKGGSSHDINCIPMWHKSLQWQAGYGIVGFGRGALPWIIRYVRDQKEHHRRGTTHDRLERVGPQEGGGESEQP